MTGRPGEVAGIRPCLYAKRERSRDRELARMTVELTQRERNP